MAKSALIEQYSDIWLDKDDYLEAERRYYEGKLGNICNVANNNMGRKNKSKQSVPVEATSSPPNPLAPQAKPEPSPPKVQAPKPETTAPKKRNDSECSNKSKSGETKEAQAVGKGKNKGPKQGPKQSSPPKNQAPAPQVGNQKSESVVPSSPSPPSSISPDVVKAAPTDSGETKMDGIAKLSGDSPALLKKISTLETENKSFKKDIQNLTDLVQKLELRLSSLEKSGGGAKPVAPTPAHAPASASNGKKEEDDDVDLFGSDSEEESEEAKKIREERLAAYNAKKSKKPVLIAKSNIILDVKPWGDDTDMKEMEKQVRAIQMDGLLWGASKLAPLAYGINKLQISCVVEDDLVSVDALQESIQDIEEYVQSVDIAAFNKV